MPRIEAISACESPSISKRVKTVRRCSVSVPEEFAQRDAFGVVDGCSVPRSSGSSSIASSSGRRLRRRNAS